jgi:hypothetical protein
MRTTLYACESCNKLQSELNVVEGDFAKLLKEHVQLCIKENMFFQVSYQMYVAYARITNSSMFTMFVDGTWKDMFKQIFDVPDSYVIEYGRISNMVQCYPGAKAPTIKETPSICSTVKEGDRVMFKDGRRTSTTGRSRRIGKVMKLNTQGNMAYVKFGSCWLWIHTEELEVCDLLGGRMG